MSIDLVNGVVIEVVAPQVVFEVAAPGSNVTTVVPVAGLPGPQGPPGVGGTYDHHQISPAATWTITHNLGKFVEPALFLDDAPTRRVLTDLDLPDANTAVITFPTPAAGWAHFTS